VEGEVVGRLEGVGVVLAEHAAIAGQSFLVEGLGLFVFFTGSVKLTV
jgi:hypothetical protein